MRPKMKVQGLEKEFLKKGTVSKLSELKVISNKTLYVSAAAIVNLDGEVLLAQRPDGKADAGLWEFPGGKIEIGETPEMAIIRELSEELHMDVKSEDVSPLNFVSYIDKSSNKNLLIYLYKVCKWRGDILPMEGQKIAWVSSMRLNYYIDIMPKPDIPLANFIVKNPAVIA